MMVIGEKEAISLKASRSITDSDGTLIKIDPWLRIVLINENGASRLQYRCSSEKLSQSEIDEFCARSKQHIIENELDNFNVDIFDVLPAIINEHVYV